MERDIERAIRELSFRMRLLKAKQEDESSSEVLIER